jgi:hypothetical protein
MNNMKDAQNCEVGVTIELFYGSGIVYGKGFGKTC